MDSCRQVFSKEDDDRKPAKKLLLVRIREKNRKAWTRKEYTFIDWSLNF